MEGRKLTWQFCHIQPLQHSLRGFRYGENVVWAGPLTLTTWTGLQEHDTWAVPISNHGNGACLQLGVVLKGLYTSVFYGVQYGRCTCRKSGLQCSTVSINCEARLSPTHQLVANDSIQPPYHSGLEKKEMGASAKEVPYGNRSKVPTGPLNLRQT